MSETPREISLNDAAHRLRGENPPILIDCRETDEFEIVHLAGARLIPMSDFRERFEELIPDRDRELIVYCHHGGRSLRVSDFLRAQGFSRACSMMGGIDGWALNIDSSLPRY